MCRLFDLYAAARPAAQADPIGAARMISSADAEPWIGLFSLGREPERVWERSILR